MVEQMEIILSAIDNASSTFESVSDTAQDLEENLQDIGSDADELDQLGEGADRAEEDIRKLGDESEDTKSEIEDLGDASQSSGVTMQVAFQNIADGVQRAKEGVVELGRNLMETLSLAGQQEQQETFLKMNIGAEGAAKQMKVINDLVADLPGDDVAIGGLLSQAAAKNSKITADELERMGTNAADYFAAMSNYGKSSVEAQQDLTNYILTGNTAELERSPILQGHIDKLKEATTVEERNKALQEAMAAEGWANISQQDTYNNKLETFTAMLDRGKRQMGEMFLDAAGGAMDFIGKLDEATGGVLGVGIAAATVATGPLVNLLTGVGQMATGVKALREAYKDLALTETLINAVEGEGAIARIASALGITTEAAAAEGATVAFGGLAIAEGAALWPILAIAAAIAALVAIVYEVGKAFGWWTDVGSMLDAISSGVMRLWNAFINHPDVQAAISAISGAISVLWGWIQQAGQAIMDFFGISTSGDFDIVRALIDGIGNAWNMLKQALSPVITAIQAVIGAFNQFRNGQMDLPQFIWSVLTILGQMYVTIFTRIGSFVVSIGLRLVRAGVNAARNFVTGIITRLRQLPGRVFSALIAVVSRIISAGAQWVSTVKQKALDVVNGAYNTLTGLPGKIASALSGVVDAIAQPFKKGYEDAKKWIDDIKNLKIPNPAARGGEPLDITGNNSLSISSSDNGPIIIEDNINLTVDLKNIPAGMSADTLITALQDKNVLNALVSNRDFQSLDAQVKQKISLKKMRSGGI